jgi:hypothetical protein
MKAGKAVSSLQYFDPSIQRELLNASKQLRPLVERLKLAQEIAATAKATTLRNAIQPAIHARIALERAVAQNCPPLIRRTTTTVIAAERRGEPTSISLPPATPKTLLAERIASRMKHSRDPISIVAMEFRSEFESLKLVRTESLDKSMVRRFQAFCSEFVYGVLIPENELRPRIRSGKRTGGRPHNY